MKVYSVRVYRDSAAYYSGEEPIAIRYLSAYNGAEAIAIVRQESGPDFYLSAELL